MERQAYVKGTAGWNGLNVPNTWPVSHLPQLWVPLGNLGDLLSLFILQAASPPPWGPLRYQGTLGGSVSSVTQKDSKGSWLSSTVATSHMDYLKLN